MSTRCNIVVRDSEGFDSQMWFYRHSDGNPETIIPFLLRFLQLVRDGKIRNNVVQACGWLIALGMEEYKSSVGQLDGSAPVSARGLHGSEWKVGSIEPTHNQHGDIAYLYCVDLSDCSIVHGRPNGFSGGCPDPLDSVVDGEKTFL